MAHLLVVKGLVRDVIFSDASSRTVNYNPNSIFSATNLYFASLFLIGGVVMSHWGNVLREARKWAGLTQEQLAEKVPISVSYIRKMETGLIGPPRRDKAEELADTL